MSSDGLEASDYLRTDLLGSPAPGIRSQCSDVILQHG